MILRRLRRLLTAVLGGIPLTFRLRARALRFAGMSVGRRSSIGSGTLFTHPDRVSIGPKTFVNHRCTFDGDVSLGSNVYVGHGTTFSSHTHEVGSPGQRAGVPRTSGITVGDGAWIGASVTVLSGVSVGAGAIVAAGAVVTEDCEADALYAGVPAVRKRALPDPDGEAAERDA